MSRYLYLGIEYLKEDENGNLKFEVLKEDIGQIVPLSIRDYAYELFKTGPIPSVGKWFNKYHELTDNDDVIYYCWLHDIETIIEKIYDMVDIESNEEAENSLLAYGVPFFEGLPLLVSFLLDQNKIYEDVLVRFVGYIS